MDSDLLTLGPDALSTAGQQARFPHPTQPSQTLPRATPIRVLVAHAHGMLLEGLAGFLARQPDIELMGAVSDSEAAWQVIRTGSPGVVILDLDPGKVRGLQVAQRVRAAGLATRCLMLATRADPGLASQSLRAGAAGCLPKDSSFDDLIRTLFIIDAGGTFVGLPMSTRRCNPQGAGQDAPTLSPREYEVVRLLAAGRTSKMIARVLDISPQTVETHRRRLMRKLHVHSATELVCYAAQSGLLD